MEAGNDLLMSTFIDDRVHQTLCVTPAMQSEISDRVWSIEEMSAPLPETQLSMNRIERALI
jgi:hypothetical protein